MKARPESETAYIDIELDEDFDPEGSDACSALNIVDLPTGFEVSPADGAPKLLKWDYERNTNYWAAPSGLRISVNV